MRYDAEGDMPPGRRNHVIVFVEPTMIYLLGGKNERQLPMKKVHIFDIGGLFWMELELGNNPSVDVSSYQGQFCENNIVLYPTNGSTSSNKKIMKLKLDALRWEEIQMPLDSSCDSYKFVPFYSGEFPIRDKYYFRLFFLNRMKEKYFPSSIKNIKRLLRIT